MIIDILTLFPEMFQGPFDASIIKRAREKELININIVNIRDFSTNKHRTVDDTPFGGGAGMVIGPEPVFNAMDYIGRQSGGFAGRVMIMCPTGRPFNQEFAKEIAREDHLVIICGHYEGFDERIHEQLVTDEVSIGDFVLTGGELPAMVVIDAVARLVPDVLGERASAEEDSFYNGLLEYPHYTRPREFRGMEVPDVLTSGHHQLIRDWRRNESLIRTMIRRPDLLEGDLLTARDKAFLKELKKTLDSCT
ncbi:MAG: tRNA (guanosine(37)-N1)-methyltransferase TrmD [Firmicutes bacterium]|nr:tRNA (guanosine(37)-N1)-methyltransferase TrmD [Bacillota bacterium]